MKRSDGFLALALALVALAASWCWRLADVLPIGWDDLAAAAGLRPATHVTGALVAPLVAACDLSVGVLAWLGAFVQALSVVGVFALARIVPVYLMRRRPQSALRRATVLRTAAAFAALAFALCEPCWLSGQFLDEAALRLALALASTVVFFAFLSSNRAVLAYGLSALTGVSCALGWEGFALSLLFAGLLFEAHRAALSVGLADVWSDPALRVARHRWGLSLMWVVSFSAALSAEIWLYVTSGAVTGAEHPVGAVLQAIVMEFYRAPQAAGGVIPLLLWVSFLVVPFVVAVACYPQAADEEYVLPYGRGIAYVVCALVAVLQFGAIPGLWGWHYAPVGSAFLLLFGMVLNALTLTLSVSVIGVEAVCRDLRLKTRPAVFCTVLALIFILSPGRARRTTVRMSEIVSHAVSDMVAECVGVSHLFTDARLDPALELAAHRRGERLLCHSLMGGSDRRSVQLRTRGVADDPEDLKAFAFDAAMGLRLWLRDKPEHLSETACQLGFDLWKREGRALPPMGGYVSRPTGWPSDDVRAQGLAASRVRAEEVLGVYAQGGIGGCVSPALKSAFEAVQWRLARMAFYRGDVAEQQGDADLALAEHGLADRLNDRNATYQRTLAQAVLRGEQMQRVPTSREGLMQSLLTADFTRAKVFADIVLASDPEEVHANFATAMFYVKQRQFSLAELHLKRCLAKRPKDAAIYNNLAMVQAEMGKYKEALDSVDNAAALLPDSAEIAQTRKFILTQQNKAAKSQNL